MMVEAVRKPHDLGGRNSNRLLTLLAVMLTLMIFVFAPLQAAGIFLFHAFAIAGLLAIIGGMLIISSNPIALGLMLMAFIANFAVFFLRLYYLWPYNLHLLAGAWLIISVTLGIVVARAVFGAGRITYHRIVGAILLYLLIAVVFAALFAVVGPVDSGCIQGDRVQGQLDTRQLTFLFELCHPDINRLRRYRSCAPNCAKSLQYRKRHWPTVSGDDFGKARDARIGGKMPSSLGRTIAAPPGWDLALLA